MILPDLIYYIFEFSTILISIVTQRCSTVSDIILCIRLFLMLNMYISLILYCTHTRELRACALWTDEAYTITQRCNKSLHNSNKGSSRTKIASEIVTPIETTFIFFSCKYEAWLDIIEKKLYKCICGISWMYKNLVKMRHIVKIYNLIAFFSKHYWNCTIISVNYVQYVSIVRNCLSSAIHWHLVNINFDSW